MAGKIRITLKKSVSGATERQRKTVLGLGLKKRNATKTLQDTPAVRGMVEKVAHLVAVDEVK